MNIPQTENSQDSSETIREVAETLNIRLPTANVPLLDGMIALLTSIGGISILANILSDIVSPNDMGIGAYLMRLINGIVMICVGYGILKRKGWTVWLYGAVSIVALYVNPILSLIPILITIHLYIEGSYFDRHLFSKIFAGNKVKELERFGQQ